MVLQKQAVDRRFELSEVDGEPIPAKVHEPRLTHRLTPLTQLNTLQLFHRMVGFLPGRQEDVGLLLPRRYRVRVRVGGDDEGECE